MCIYYNEGIINNLRAFSLIELMVVIAIVAVLASVAAPLYNDYIRRVKIVKALDVLESYADIAIKYTDTHGGTLFTSVDAIGLTPEPAAPLSMLQPTTHSQYIAPNLPFVFFGQNPVFGNNCMYITASTYLTNIDNSTEVWGGSPLAYINMNLFYFYKLDGVVERICTFTDVNSLGQGNVNTSIPGCYNVISPTQGPAYGARLTEINAGCIVS